MIHLGSVNFLTRLFCVQSIKDSVTTKYDEVVLLIFYAYVMNFGIGDYYVWVSIVFLKLRLTISKCSRNRKSPWNNTNWPLCNWTSRSSQHNVIILINLSPSLYYPFPLWLFRWLMIIWNLSKLCTHIWRENCSTITSICEPNIMIDNKHNDCTRARFVSNLN